MTPESFIPAEDLAKHAKPGELWLLIHGKGERTSGMFLTQHCVDARIHSIRCVHIYEQRECPKLGWVLVNSY